MVFDLDIVTSFLQKYRLNRCLYSDVNNALLHPSKMHALYTSRVVFAEAWLK